MLLHHDIIKTLDSIPIPNALWSGAYKIPWNDPEFSHRMLYEHLTQDHDLASRRSETIQAQARWLHHEILGDTPSSILDLGCGPGLYAPHFTNQGHTYRGMDFGPASIDHAKLHYEKPNQCTFALGNVLHEEFEEPYDLVTLLYGELNIFPPEDCAKLLTKAYKALAPGGRIVLEAHTHAAVQGIAQGNGWYTAQSGLFSDNPHLCLTSSHWYPEQNVALQCFHVAIPETGTLQSYRNTVQAWTDEEYHQLLKTAGFNDTIFHQDWPGGQDMLQLISGRK
ncbi:class I SAM-dependent methyltransferase [Desulfovibrio ferrophilus]|uniref:Methylase involved in ubiquinone/menaquinone biosynthesis n=1 Tax=Desulfovibrio ferrophilus TaxID=241368 RepID=A0A2Z6B2X4_9BACT|nr:class I SAM-dependent methyltransferase [Desulfovibrio ferrophilus]BBD09841.1 methylase involved in ubiquinone/menaquinone biosynthesis [Desulfovibrio ferrophilus]